MLVGVFHESGERGDLEAIFLRFSGHLRYRLFVADHCRHGNLVVTQAGHLRNLVHKRLRPVRVVLQEGDSLNLPWFHLNLPCPDPYAARTNVRTPGE